MALARQAAHFLKAACIQQGRQTLARVEPTLRVQLGQGLRPAHGQRLLAAQGQLAQFGFPDPSGLETLRVLQRRLLTHLASPISCTSALMACCSLAMYCSDSAALRNTGLPPFFSTSACQWGF